MKDFFWMLLSVIVAFLLYSALGKMSLSLFQLFNFFTLVVIYFAVEKGEIYGACLGAFCGLIQDSFSISVFGVAGIAKTVVGFLAGYFAGKINVIPIRRSFFFILILNCVELLIWAGLYSFILSERVNTGGGMLFFQPLLTAFLGAVVFSQLRRKKSLLLD